MARPLAFDREQALQKALFLFWRQGYVATGLNQLLEEMQIGRSSFYAAFGDKQGLFVEVFKRYNRSFEKLLIDVSQSNNAQAAMRQYIEFSFKPRYNSEIHFGCFVVNTLLELHEVDNDLAKLASDQLNNVEAAFAQCFHRAARHGQLSSHQPQRLAQMFRSFMQGLRVSARNGVSVDDLQQQAYAFVDLLHLPPSAKHPTAS